MKVREHLIDIDVEDVVSEVFSLINVGDIVTYVAAYNQVEALSLYRNAKRCIVIEKHLKECLSLGRTIILTVLGERGLYFETVTADVYNITGQMYNCRTQVALPKFRYCFVNFPA